MTLMDIWIKTMNEKKLKPYYNFFGSSLNNIFASWFRSRDGLNDLVLIEMRSYHCLWINERISKNK